MKTAQLQLKFPSDRVANIEVTFTDSACLVVHPTMHWPLGNDAPVIIEKDWTISQYPTGYKLFDGIPTFRTAVECADKYLNSKLFIGMSENDFQNDLRLANLTQAEIDEGIAALVNAREFITKCIEGSLP